MKKKILITALFSALLFSACKKDKEFKLDNGSVASWKGFLETGYFNSGTIALNASGIAVSDGQITGGEIKIPVSSILITNQLPDDKKIQLMNHLKSDAFFNMLVHPNVIYTVYTTQKLSTADAEGNNYLIKGEMSLLGKILPLDILAKIENSKGAIHVKSEFKFDRTKWGMLYASDNALPPDQKIKNDIQVSIDIHISN